MELVLAERLSSRSAAPRWLRLRAAAAAHGLSVTVLKAAARAGDLPVVRTGRVLWVKETDLIAFLARRVCLTTQTGVASAVASAVASTASAANTAAA